MSSRAPSVARRARLVAQGVAVGLVALLFVLLVWALVTDEGGDLAKKANRGDLPAAPLLALERLDGDGEQKLELSSLAGKAIVLNFWASWCAPCKDEAPFLEELWREHRDRDLVVLGLDSRDFRADARRFADRFGLTFPLAYDGPGDEASSFGVTGYPETFVIDREGKVVAAFKGGVDGDDVRPRLLEAIDEALAT